MENTGHKDKNGKDIFTGDTVRFKHCGHYFRVKVHKTKGYYYPFDPTISVEVGVYICPEECEKIILTKQ